MSECGKQPDKHCCWVQGKPCRYLKTTTQKVRKEEGFYWRCKLREELGSWEAVHACERYTTEIKPKWVETGVPDCGDWPKGNNGFACTVCGIKDNG